MEREKDSQAKENQTAVSSSDKESTEDKDDEDGPFAGMRSESFHSGERPSLADVSGSLFQKAF